MLAHYVFGSGKDIIFLHGWGGSSVSFLGTAKALAYGHRVTLVDFYGFGDTPEPSKPFNLDDCARAVGQIIRNKCMSGAVVVGHSFGGRVAVRLARMYPSYVEKLVLIDSAGLRPRRKLSYYLKVLFHKLSVKLGGKGLKGSPDYMALSPVMKKSFVNIVNDYTNKDLRYISAPTLIVWGSEDKETPLYMARKFKRGIKKSVLKIFKGAGHYAYLDRFIETNALLRTYIDGDD